MTPLALATLRMLQGIDPAKLTDAELDNHIDAICNELNIADLPIWAQREVVRALSAPKQEMN